MSVQILSIYNQTVYFFKMTRLSFKLFHFEHLQPWKLTSMLICKISFTIILALVVFVISKFHII